MKTLNDLRVRRISLVERKMSVEEMKNWKKLKSCLIHSVFQWSRCWNKGLRNVRGPGNKLGGELNSSPGNNTLSPITR